MMPDICPYKMLCTLEYRRQISRNKIGGHLERSHIDTITAVYRSVMLNDKSLLKRCLIDFIQWTILYFLYKY